MEANSLHEHDKRLSKANTVASLPTFYIGSTPGTDNTIDANTNNKNSPTSRNENNQEATNEVNIQYHYLVILIFQFKN